MSEQKFYKQVPVTKPWYETYERGSTFIEATDEDFEKAGYVKREKVRFIYTKLIWED